MNQSDKETYTSKDYDFDNRFPIKGISNEEFLRYELEVYNTNEHNSNNISNDEWKSYLESEISDLKTMWDYPGKSERLTDLENMLKQEKAKK